MKNLFLLLATLGLATGAFAQEAAPDSAPSEGEIVQNDINKQMDSQATNATDSHESGCGCGKKKPK